MAPLLWYFCLCFSLFFLPFMAAAQSGADSELELGIQAYKQAKFEVAVAHFQNATTLDPNNEDAHAYLAAALAEQYIPGLETPENKHIGDAAISEYEKTLEIDPRSKRSVKAIAYVLLQMKKFDDAKSYYREALDLDANDPEIYYSIAVIDWTVAYRPRMELRGKLGLKPDQHLPIDFEGCWDLRNSNLPVVQEGVEMLTKALDLSPDYDDAMAYMNLLYRERAEIECNDRQSRAADLQAADKWLDLTLAEKKRKAESSNPENPVPAAPQ